MDWFSSNSSRPVRTVEFYQQKLLHFLFSAEGRDDVRCLNIPFPQLGFYSPMHFINCIPSEMCEPFRNDKLFLATNGEIRKGDKVLLVQDNGSEGIVQSAVFKGRRIGKSGEPEILLDGHRTTYTEEEVVPYKAYLRDQLGTALVPEENFFIDEDGILEWEEPSWEPGQEVYYKPEKRWATILSDELSARGRIVVNLKMEQTNFKKEKIIKIPLDDLKANSVPIRVPLKRPKGKANSVDDLIQKVNEEFKEIYQADHADREKLEEEEMVEHVQKGNSKRRDYDDDERRPEPSSAPGKKHVKYANGDAPGAGKQQGSNSNGYAVVAKKEHVEMAAATPDMQQVEVMKENEYATMRKKNDNGDKGGISVLQSVLRPKRSKRPKERPVTEYIPDRTYNPTQQQEQPPLPERNRPMQNKIATEEQPKFKSCNNLTSAAYSDDELEPFELVNYTNSLRSSARKILQRQMAEGSKDRTASLKLRQSSSSSNRPHVTEVFTWNDEKGRMTRRTSETSAVTQKRKETHLDEPPKNLGYQRQTTSNPLQRVPMTMTSAQRAQTPDRSRVSSPPPPLVRKNTPSPSPSSSNNLNKSLSQPDIRRDVIDSAKKPSAYGPAPPPKPVLKSQSQNPLDFEFAPLSSSELVKKQLAIVNRVLHEPQIKGGVLYQDLILPGKGKNGKKYDDSSIRVHTGASSDSSSHDNDSGRGSYQFMSDTVKGTEEVVGMDHVRYSPSKVMINSAESVYANENMTIYSQNGNGVHSPEPRESSPTRRYVKHRSSSASRNTSQRYNGAMKDNDSEEELTIAQPFNPGNLSPVAGYGRGIQGSLSSSFMDATLYALFACSNIFDRLLLFSKPGLVEKGIKRDVRRILRDKVVMPLRTAAYVKKENMTHLREAMLPLSTKMNSSLMDAEEFLNLLFDTALNTEKFIEFSNGTKAFMYQIIARPKDRSKSQTVQFMMETSLSTSTLKFNQAPSPALFLCIPRCKGRLVYYDAIIPSLQLNITRLLHKGPKQCVCEMAATLECILCHQKNGDLALDFCQNCKGIADQVHYRLDHNPILIPKKQNDELLNLHSIICTRGSGNHVCFVKVSEKRLSPWLYLDPMGEYPEVTLLEDFGKWLDSLERQPGSYREFAKLHPLLKRIMTDSFIYIYSKTHLEGTEPKESMRI